MTRLHTLGVDPQLVAESLLGVLSQRLVRRLCPACRRPGDPDDATRRKLRLGPEERGFWRAGGCPECRQSGYRGRVGLYELFPVDDELADLIGAQTPLSLVRESAFRKGMRTLLDDALAKAREGVTSLEEVLRVMPLRVLHARRSGRS